MFSNSKTTAGRGVKQNEEGPLGPSLIVKDNGNFDMEGRPGSSCRQTLTQTSTYRTTDHRLYLYPTPFDFVTVRPKRDSCRARSDF